MLISDTPMNMYTYYTNAHVHTHTNMTHTGLNKQCLSVPRQAGSCLLAEYPGAQRPRLSYVWFLSSQHLHLSGKRIGTEAHGLLRRACSYRYN